MCRSIKRLREPSGPAAEDDVRAAARQFVKKVSGFQRPSAGNSAAFEAAIDEVAEATQRLLASLPPLKVAAAATETELARATGSNAMR